MKKELYLFSAFFFVTCSVFGQEEIKGTSNKVTLTVGQQPAVAVSALGLTTLPTYHALIIGISQYKYTGPGLPNLDQPIKDAQHLANVLIEKYEFKAENITVLKNPTREDIINKFDLLADQIGVRDNLLIFYAGHGFYDKSKDFGFWLPSNAKTTSRADWIANSTIKDYISAIQSKHTFLITDACFGGSIFKTRSIDALGAKRFHEIYKDKSRKAITSGNLTEVPDKSFFVEFLIKILDENQEDFLPASTLFTRLYEPVLNNTSTIPQFGIIQGAGDEGGDFIFIRKPKP